MRAAVSRISEEKNTNVYIVKRVRYLQSCRFRLRYNSNRIHGFFMNIHDIRRMTLYRTKLRYYLKISEIEQYRKEKSDIRNLTM